MPTDQPSRAPRYSVVIPEHGGAPYVILPLGRNWTSHPEADAIGKVIWDSGGRDHDRAMTLNDCHQARHVALSHALGFDSHGNRVSREVRDGAKRVVRKIDHCFAALAAAGVSDVKGNASGRHPSEPDASSVPPVPAIDVTPRPAGPRTVKPATNAESRVIGDDVAETSLTPFATQQAADESFQPDESLPNFKTHEIREIVARVTGLRERSVALRGLTGTARERVEAAHRRELEGVIGQHLAQLPLDELKRTGVTGLRLGTLTEVASCRRCNRGWA